jgi:signal transduction histidine kinase
MSTRRATPHDPSTAAPLPESAAEPTAGPQGPVAGRGDGSPREQLLRATLESWPHGLVLVDARSGAVLELNRRFAQRFELGADAAADLLGAPLAKLAHACRAALADPAAFEEFLDGRAQTARLVLRNASVLECSSHGVELAQLALQARLLVFEDATERTRGEDERRTLERRMRELERLESLGTLAGGIAHEFNNLLTGILGSAELVLAGVPENDRARRQLERIIEASLRAAALCEEMIASAGPGVVEVRRLHLSDLTHRALRLMQPTVSTRIHVEERIERELPAVLVDEAQLRRVFENVFLNACEAVEAKGGSVRVATGVSRMEARAFDALPLAPGLPAGDYVWFEVEDDGVGMDAATQSRMFDPFFSTKFAGRGLGLSSTAAIVRGHKGAIEVHSRVGSGTRVRVLLPRAH